MSKIAVISDIHGNFPALKAVISALEKKSPDLWLCLGDLVGYGPHPAECIKLVRDMNMKCVLGNHDAGVTGRISLDLFRNPNRKLIKRTQEILFDEDKEWLAQLPLTLKADDDSWLAVHASPRNPENWEYLDSTFKMRPLFADLKQQVCFIGHTHRPGIVSEEIGLKEFEAGHKFFINPGSVGQSRDGDYRASCAFIDTGSYQYENIRVKYELEKVLSDLKVLGFSRRESEHLMRIL